MQGSCYDSTVFFGAFIGFTSSADDPPSRSVCQAQCPNTEALHTPSLVVPSLPALTLFRQLLNPAHHARQLS